MDIKTQPGRVRWRGRKETIGRRLWNEKWTVGRETVAENSIKRFGGRSVCNYRRTGGTWSGHDRDQILQLPTFSFVSTWQKPWRRHHQEFLGCLLAQSYLQLRTQYGESHRRCSFSFEILFEFRFNEKHGEQARFVIPLEKENREKKKKTVETTNPRRSVLSAFSLRPSSEAELFK